MIFLLLTACVDNAVHAGLPKADVSPASIDFGEVVLGTAAQIGVNVQNSGIGELEVSAASMSDISSPDLRVVDFPKSVSRDAAGVLTIEYQPDVEGQDFGSVTITSNDKDNPTIEVPIEGTGVRPHCDVDPELLYFGTLAVGESATQTVRISASGSGDLRIRSIAFAGEEDAAYTFSLPTEYAEPYTLANGFSIAMNVTFAPPSADEFTGEVLVTTNDPDEEQVAVHLYGNTVDDPTKNESPVVEILDPNTGEHFLSTQVVTLSGHVYDQDEAATNLTCTWYAAGTPVAAALPTGAGDVMSTAMLPVGAIDVALRCFDSAGAMGEDVASVEVFDPDKPLPYVISGGTSLFDYISVDDDLEIKLNGTRIYVDASGEASTLAPIKFEAAVGDQLEIIATDQKYCRAYLDSLRLFWGSGDMQVLNVDTCHSACEGEDCYDEDYAGPWPNVFLDEFYTIEIP